MTPGGHTAIEVKAKDPIVAQDLRSLQTLTDERLLKRYLCVCLESRRRQVGEITVLPYRQFLEALWSGDYSG